MFAHPKYENQLLEHNFKKKHHEQCQCITICSLLQTQQRRWILVRLILCGCTQIEVNIELMCEEGQCGFKTL
jgi:hypothetical protein